MTTREESTIKSARRVLEIPEYFDRDHPSATVMDLARALAYPQSSTSALLRSLTRLGYLHYDPVVRTYTPKARVALLGAWVEPSLFRGGALSQALDQVAQRLGHTVLLSTVANHGVQHLHAVRGAAETAVHAPAARDEPLLHSPQGRLILSSYRDIHIHAVLHRLIAEEPDPSRRVPRAETLQQLRAVRAQGFIVQLGGPGDAAGAVAVLSPPTARGGERLALSVVAPGETVAARRDEFLRIMREECERRLPAPPAPSFATRRRFGSSPRTGLAEGSQTGQDPQELVA